MQTQRCKGAKKEKNQRNDKSAISSCLGRSFFSSFGFWRLCVSLSLSFLFFAFQLHADVSTVLTWNNQATEASQEMQESLPSAARSLAILQTAVYDTIQAVQKERKLIYVNPQSLQDNEGEIYLDAAITAAAHRVLSQLYPKLAYQFDAKLLQMYAEMPVNPATKQGILLGREVADQVLTWRSRDFETALLPFVDTQESERWRPAPGTAALLPNWATQPYFVVQSDADFYVEPPVKEDSQRYLEEYYYIKRIGSRQSRERLSDHLAQGLFFGQPTVTPIVYWNGVARRLIKEKGLNQGQAAHLLALLNVSLSDCVMSAWKNKYHYLTLRPEESIHQVRAETKSNLRADKEWKPLIATPNYPDYPSAHAACAGAASVVLQGYVGDNCSFYCSNTGTSNAEEKVKQGAVAARHYRSFSAAAKESAESRLYAGVCFPCSTAAGLQLGKRIAYYVLEQSTKKIPDPS